MKRFIPILVAGLLLMAGPLAAQQSHAAATPTLKVKTLSGAPFDLAAHRGKWVIVNYWATWCRPCIKEMPALSDFVRKHADVTAIGLAFEDTKPATLQAFLAAHPVVYPIAQVDPANPPSAFASPLGLPTTYLIAPDGTVSQRYVGPLDMAKLASAIGKGS